MSAIDKLVEQAKALGITEAKPKDHTVPEDIINGVDEIIKNLDMVHKTANAALTTIAGHFAAVANIEPKNATALLRCAQYLRIDTSNGQNTVRGKTVVENPQSYEFSMKVKNTLKPKHETAAKAKPETSAKGKPRSGSPLPKTR